MQPSTTVNVFPNLKRSITICRAVIEPTEYKLFAYLKLRVMLFDINDSLVEVQVFSLEGDDFAKWGDDDAYVVNWVKSKLQDEG